MGSANFKVFKAKKYKKLFYGSKYENTKYYISSSITFSLFKFITVRLFTLIKYIQSYNYKIIPQNYIKTKHKVKLMGFLNFNSINLLTVGNILYVEILN